MSGSTQSQALNAIVFLDRNVLIPQRTEARSGVIDILLTPKDEEDVKYGKEPSMSVRAPFKRKWVRRPTINTSVTPMAARPERIRLAHYRNTC